MCPMDSQTDSSYAYQSQGALGNIDCREPEGQIHDWLKSVVLSTMLLPRFSKSHEADEGIFWSSGIW